MNQQVEQSTDLLVIQPANVMTVFTTAGSLDPILAKIAEEVRSAKFDPHDAKDRKAIASLAYKVAKTKTYIDGLGKTLNDELKEIPKKVDASRKQAWDFLEALQKEARKPLDDWEAEQARIAEENRLRIEAEESAKKLEADHELALLMNADFDRELEARRIAAEEESKRLEDERIERERLIALQAAENAKRESEEKADRELKAAEAEALRKEQEAKRIADDLLRQQQEATVMAERQAAILRSTMEREAREAKEREAQAVERERQRIENERLQEEEEERKREANKKHCATINNAAMNDFIKAGYTGEVAKAIVVLNCQQKNIKR